MKQKVENKNPILYSFRRCPYAMRARIAIHRAQVRCEIREVVLKAKPQSLLDASPKGTVPVVILPGGGVLEESLDIMKWALKQNDPEGWLTGYNQECEALIEANDNGFKTALDRYKYPNRYENLDPLEFRKKGEFFLVQLESRLSKKAFLSGDSRTFTDIAIFPFVRQFAKVDPQWFQEQPFQNLQKWLDLLTKSKLFQSVMKKYQLWVPGQSPEFFGAEG